MDAIQAVQDKMLAEIEDIDGGWTKVAEKLGISVAALRKTVLSPDGRTPRLATLEKIKEGIRECQSEQNERLNALLT